MLRKKQHVFTSVKNDNLRQTLEGMRTGRDKKSDKEEEEQRERKIKDRKRRKKQK